MVNPILNPHSKLYYRIRQSGWQGILGLALIAISILLMLFVVMPSINNWDAMMIRFTALEENKANGKMQSIPDPQIDIVALLNRQLPQQEEANRKIAQILHAATDAGLVTDKVDYASQPYSTSLLKYQIRLPTQGSYIQIRQFIQAVLNALPTAALADIQFRREDIGSELIDANIQFNLYVSKNAYLGKSDH